MAATQFHSMPASLHLFGGQNNNGRVCKCLPRDLQAATTCSLAAVATGHPAAPRPRLRTHHTHAYTHATMAQQLQCSGRPCVQSQTCARRATGRHVTSVTAHLQTGPQAFARTAAHAADSAEAPSAPSTSRRAVGLTLGLAVLLPSLGLADTSPAHAG